MQPKSSESVPIPVGSDTDVTAADDVCVFRRYLNAIQTMCPHILRYLTTAVITNKDVRKRRQVLKDLVKVIQQVSSLTASQITANAVGGLSRRLNDIHPHPPFSLNAPGVVHLQGPNHRVRGVSVREL